MPSSDPTNSADDDGNGDNSRSPIDDLLDVFVFAPLGFASDVPRLLPELAERGRQEVNNAKAIGKFAVAQSQQMGDGSVQKTAEAVLGIIFPGMARSNTDAASGSGAQSTATSNDSTDAEAGPASAGGDGAPSKAGKGSSSGKKKPAGKKKAAATTATAKKSAAKRKTPAKKKPAAKKVAAAKSGAPKKKPAKKRTTSKKSSASKSDGSVAVTDLAIDDYDGLSASQIVGMLDGLRKKELALISRYEVANRNRRTILGRIAQLSA